MWDEGVGTTVKHIPVIKDEKNPLWSTKTINEHSPVALQQAVFYYVGKGFCLCGETEQRSIKLPQNKRLTQIPYFLV